MKLRDLEKALKELGWYLHREGGKHHIWTNGRKTLSVPRHAEVNEFTARGIISDGIKKNKE